MLRSIKSSQGDFGLTNAVLSIVLLATSRQSFAGLQDGLGVSSVKEVSFANFPEPGYLRRGEALSNGFLSDDGRYIFSKLGTRFDLGTSRGVVISVSEVLDRLQRRKPAPLLALSPLPDGVVRHGKVPGPGIILLDSCYGSTDGWRIWLRAQNRSETDIGEVDFTKLQAQQPALSSFINSKGYVSEMPEGLVRDQATDRLLVQWKRGKYCQLGLVDFLGKVTRYKRLVPPILGAACFDSRSATLYYWTNSNKNFELTALNLESGETRIALNLDPKGAWYGTSGLAGGRFLVNSASDNCVTLFERSGVPRRFTGLRVYSASASGKVVLIGGANILDPARVLFLR